MVIFHSYVTVYQRVMIPNDPYLMLETATIRLQPGSVDPEEDKTVAASTNTPFMVYLCVCVHIYYKYYIL